MNSYDKLGPPYAATWYVPPGWSVWRAFATPPHYYDYRTVDESGTVSTYGHEVSDYSTDVLRDQVVSFIRSSPAPWFAYFVPYAPHLDTAFLPVPKAEDRDTFAGIPPWRPPSYNEADVSHKPAWVQALEPMTPEYQAATDLHRQRQLETLQAVDRAVHAIVAAVAAKGELDRTVFVFLSDNGYTWGEHRIFIEKGCPYEECIRVPLVIRAPNLPHVPRTEAALVMNVDIAPTLAALAGVSAQPVDGTSLLPLLEQSPVTWRTSVELEQRRFGLVYTGTAPRRGRRSCTRPASASSTT